jgi:hypothetical protein
VALRVAIPLRAARLCKYRERPKGPDRRDISQSLARVGQGISALADQGTFGQGTFELRPSAEAKEGDVLVAEQAAVSRLRPIQDGLDYWGEHWMSAVTVSGDAWCHRALHLDS